LAKETYDPASPDHEAEARMRRSLGIGSKPTSGGRGPQPRSRFVRDGDVPVVVLHPKSESETRHAAALAELTGQLAREREAHTRTEQALRDARSTIQTLQTRLAHAEIALAERVPAAGPPPSEPQPAPADAEIPIRAVKKRAKRPAVPRSSEPKPIKWWTAAFKAKQKRR
jgi:hypothetical protein